MIQRRRFLYVGAAALAAMALPRLFAQAAPGAQARADGPEGPDESASFEIRRSADEWRARLTPAQYRILREAGTELPYSSPLNNEHRAGTFACAGCELPLFSSQAKFDSHTGWPSFWQPLDAAVGTRTDRTYGMVRTEVHCRRCGGHLGHLFDDGPPPTGLRYCMNGAAMAFSPA